MKTYTLDEVKSAFRRLEEYAAGQGVDADCMWAIHEAAEDGIRILTGEWSPEGEGPDEEGLTVAALEARTAEAFDAAVLLLTGFDGREEVTRARAAVHEGWRPSPRANESMLGALEVYEEKRAGALGRGAARGEAETFALMEARRAYWMLREG